MCLCVEMGSGVTVGGPDVFSRSEVRVFTGVVGPGGC